MSSDERRTASIRHLIVKRTARYAMLGEPGEGIDDVWIVCHGHAQLARNFIERFRVIEAPARLIVAPEALNHYYLDGGFRGASSKVGATWMTTEDRENEITDYVSYLDDLHEEVFRVASRAKCRLTVLGFSQGVATAARWVAVGKVRPDRVVLWAGSLPTELTPDGARRLNGNEGSLMIVAGAQDQFITPKVLDAQLSALAELGVIPVVTRYTGGHELDPLTLESLAQGR